jgi:Zn-dependent protease with chaperone function
MNNQYTKNHFEKSTRVIGLIIGFIILLLLFLSGFYDGFYENLRRGGLGRDSQIITLGFIVSNILVLWFSRFRIGIFFSLLIFKFSSTIKKLLSWMIKKI